MIIKWLCFGKIQHLEQLNINISRWICRSVERSWPDDNKKSTLFQKTKLPLISYKQEKKKATYNFTWLPQTSRCKALWLSPKKIPGPNRYKMSDFQFSHDVTKIQTTKLLILLIFYFNDVQEQLKTNIHTYFCFEWALGFVIDYNWVSNPLRDAAFTWRPSWSKSDLFRGICLSKQFLYGKMHYLNVF